MEFLCNTIIDRLKNMKKIDLNTSKDNIRMNASSISVKDDNDLTEKKYKNECCLISWLYIVIIYIYLLDLKSQY